MKYLNGKGGLGPVEEGPMEDGHMEDGQQESSDERYETTPQSTQEAQQIA